MSNDPVAICDVVGCKEPPIGTYLDARDPRHFVFGVCVEHLDRLKTGEQPRIVAEHIEGTQTYARPALGLDCGSPPNHKEPTTAGPAASHTEESQRAPTNRRAPRPQAES